MQVPLLSFFTGGGFLDMGFESSGFEICWTNEVNSHFAAMYESAVTGWRRSYLGLATEAKISEPRGIDQLTAHEVVEAAFPLGRPDQFGIVGGPPCTDFSIGGLHEGGEGQQGRLTHTFVEMVCGVDPEFFVIENVPALAVNQKHRTFLFKQVARLEGAGYAVDFRVLNALEFGVPQARHRLFIVGFKQEFVEERLGHPIIAGTRGWFPWPSDSHYTGSQDLAWPGTYPYGQEPERPDGLPLELTVYHAFTYPCDAESAPNGDEAFEPYSRKFKEIDEGDVKGKSFKRLHRYRFSPTAWYGNNEVHLHPWKPRRISVREALRIQSVPDTYILPRDAALQHKFKLICNGVPCILSTALAGAVGRFLRGISTREDGYTRPDGTASFAPEVLSTLVSAEPPRIPLAAG